MNKMFKIADARDEVRLSLRVEDVVLYNPKAAVEFGLVDIRHFKVGEVMSSVMVFKEPFRVPKFRKFFASRIKSVEDSYFVDLCLRLLYLNPNPDELMMRRLTECIVMKFSSMEMRPSEVQVGQLVAKPVLKYEDVLAGLKVVKKNFSGYEPDNEDMVMFSKAYEVPKSDKIRIRARIRQEYVALKLESVIHTTAEHLIDTQEYMKITGARLEGTKMVKVNDKPASIRSIRKYMSPRTKGIIDEHNEVAPFKTENLYAKYQCYLELPPGKSLDWVSVELGISKSTAKEFRELQNKL